MFYISSVKRGVIAEAAAFRRVSHGDAATYLFPSGREPFYSDVLPRRGSRRLPEYTAELRNAEKEMLRQYRNGTIYGEYESGGDPEKLNERWKVRW